MNLGLHTDYMLGYSTKFEFYINPKPSSNTGCSCLVEYPGNQDKQLELKYLSNLHILSSGNPQWHNTYLKNDSPANL